MAKKKKIDPPHTGVLKCDAPGGPNFVEAYGWNWWRSVVRVILMKTLKMMTNRTGMTKLSIHSLIEVVNEPERN